MTINPSKRYTKEIAEKEASDLVEDLVKALEKKNLSEEAFLRILNFIGKVAQEMGLAINDCKDCKVSYSNGKIEGFCEKHQNLAIIFQKEIDKILRA